MAYEGTWTVSNSAFTGNHSANHGAMAYGGIWEANNSTFSGNYTASGKDAGVAFRSNFTATNCIFNDRWRFKRRLEITC